MAVFLIPIVSNCHVEKVGNFYSALFALVVCYAYDKATSPM